jgi:hypothetical protein
MPLPSFFKCVWTLALLSLAAPAFAGADECVDCTSKKLCDPHGVLERNVLRDANAAWKKATPAERVEWLAKVAALTAGHDNAPSKAVVTFLSRAVEDEDEVVRERALDLLASGQHAEASLSVLTGVIDEQIEWKKKPPKLDSKPVPSGKSLEEMTPKERKEMIEQTKLMLEGRDPLSLYFDEYSRRHATCARILQRIVRRGDDSARSTAFLYFKRLQRYCTGTACGGCSAAVLEVGGYQAFEAVIGGLDKRDGDGSPEPSTKLGGEPTPTFGSSVVAALEAARVRYRLPEPKPQPSGLARDVWREWLRDNAEALGQR